MAACPRCHHTLLPNTVRCPQCDLELAAHGHIGMPLHRATGEHPLCTTCAYEADNSCTFPKRPTAMTCTLYQDIDTKPDPTSRKEIYPITRQRQNSAGLAIAILIILFLIIISL